MNDGNGHRKSNLVGVEQQSNVNYTPQIPKRREDRRLQPASLTDLGEGRLIPPNNVD